jgi:hypothetical protein
MDKASITTKQMTAQSEPQEEVTVASCAQILDYELSVCSTRLPRRINIPMWVVRMIARHIKRRVIRNYERYERCLENSKFVREHKSLYEAIDRSKAMKKAGILTKSGHFKKR